MTIPVDLSELRQLMNTGAAGELSSVIENIQNNHIVNVSDSSVSWVKTEAALTAAQAGACKHIVVTDSFSLTTSITITKGLTILKGAIITCTGTLLVINGPFITGFRKCFIAASSELTFAGGSVDRIFPEWFGAAGDGITDDTTAVEAAIASGAANSIPVWFSALYVVNEADLKSGCVIDGFGTFIKKAGSATYALACTTVEVYHDIIIRNVTINGNKASCTAGGGIAISGINLLIDSVHIYNTPHAAINVGYRLGTRNIRIVNNHILNPALSGNWWGGIGITAGRDVFISGNVIESTDGFMTYGIAYEPDVGTPAAQTGNVIITDNVIAGGRIFIDGENIAGPIPDVLVANNIVDARGSAISNGANEAPFYVRRTNYLAIKGNTSISIDSGSTNNILAVDMDHLNSNFTIAGNDFYCYGLAGSCSAIRMLTTNSYGLVQNNSITGLGANPLTYGVQAYNTAAGDHLTVRGNTYLNCTNWYSITDTNSVLERAIGKGISGARPSLLALDIGVMYMDTTLDADGLPIFWNGTKWIKADGTDA